MIGLYNHLLSKVLRSHYHSQKVIGSLGPGHWALEDCCFLFPKMVGLHPQLESVTGAQPWISSTLGDPPWVFDIEWRQQKQMIVALLHMARVYISGQIIATSHDLTPSGVLVREIPLFHWNLGWWIIFILPDMCYLTFIKVNASSLRGSPLWNQQFAPESLGLVQVQFRTFLDRQNVSNPHQLLQRNA